MYKLLFFLIPILFLGCSSERSTLNTAPIADAGKFQYLEAGSTVFLNGSESSDKDNDLLAYKWEILSTPPNSTVQLSSSTSISPYFVSDEEGDYIIQLVVNDGRMNSEPALVTISTVTFVDPSTGVQADNQIFTPTSTSMNDRPMLVIRLAFSNQTFISDETTWQQKLFGTQAGQLNDYYREISHDQFAFAPVINDGNVIDGVVTVTFSESHPDPDIDSSTFTQQLHPYLKSAIEIIYDNGNGFNFAIYDTNSDGSITPDELIITFIMAGEEDAYSGGTTGNGVWAHQWCTESNYTPTVGSVTIMSCDSSGNYAIFGERHKDSSSIPSHDASIGIIAHELGHSAFNLPDLYSGSGTRIGYYGLMANGSWGQIGESGFPGDTPTHMCAWSKIDTGWYSASSTSNNKDSDLQVHATGTSDYNIIKTPFKNSADEYFLLENRGDSGYDAGLKFVNPTFSGGMAIWHIDEAVINAKRTDNNINSSASHKGVDLEEAAGPTVDYGNGDPALNLYHSGNVDTFTPNTLPNTNLYSNERSFIFFTDISAISDTMTVRINNPQ